MSTKRPADPLSSTNEEKKPKISDEDDENSQQIGKTSDKIEVGENESLETEKPNRKIRGKYKKFDKQAVLDAAEEVKSKKLSLNMAARYYKVSQVSIKNCLMTGTADRKKRVRESALKYHEERELVKWIKYGWAMGDLRTIDEVALAVVEILELNQRHGVFKYGIPQRQWVEYFANRHKREIKIRKSNEEIDEGRFFQKFSGFFEKSKFLDVLRRPDAFYIIEDANFELELEKFSPDRRICLKKALMKKSITEKPSEYRLDKSVTVNYCFGANGRVLPQLVIFRESYNDMIKVALADKQLNSNFLFTRTEDGGNTQDSMRGFLERIDAQLADVERPIFIFFHATLPCIGIETTSWCREKQIYVISFIPNNTSVLCNMSGAIFGNKNFGWAQEIKNYLKEHKASVFAEEDFIRVLKRMNDRVISNSKIIDSFAKAGVFPFDSRKTSKVQSDEEEMDEEKIHNGGKRTVKDLVRIISDQNKTLAQKLVTIGADELLFCGKVIEQQLNIIQDCYLGVL